MKFLEAIRTVSDGCVHGPKGQICASCRQALLEYIERIVAWKKASPR